MKKNYIVPEIFLSGLMTEDVLAASLLIKFDDINESTGEWNNEW